MDAMQKIRAIRSNVNPLDIYAKIPALSEALYKKPSQVSDPLTGEGTTVFRIANNGSTYLNGIGYMDVIDTVAYVLGLAKMEACDEISRLANLKLDVKYEAKPFKPAEYHLPEADVIKRKASLRAVWSKSVLATDSDHVKAYLQGRGLDISDIPNTLRGLSSCMYLENVDGQLVKSWHPALLGVFFDKKGTPLTLHRIYLTKDGKKAPVSDVKKIMSPPGDMRGGAIRIDYDAGEHLAVAEGIETAMAVREMSGLPTWACYSDSLLEAVHIPNTVKRVSIFADKDVSGAGQAAAERLRKRLESLGIDAKVFIPKLPIPEGAKGVDWLDEYNSFSKNTAA
ncbi:DUF7146 domain-containing protein [Shewanella sp. SM87]|jgi:hypothetical protein|uniref:DUF7146 domain-containing protein n=1 Tax=Shewanella TaxID=22 RepID=UPI0021D8C12F|nr:toprim domain-containing protein [Shewanella sp. SM87]MCU8010214.1 toprim domain-containing protein [Shewanella sp. SM87]